MNKWSTENFGGNENTLYDTIMMDIHVQTHSMKNMNSELQCKLWTLGDYVVSM